MSHRLQKVSHDTGPKLLSNCVTIAEENSTVEIVESSNCVINIDYFVKDEKISLELYKTSTDSKCVTQNRRSSKALDKIKACTKINYQKDVKHRHKRKDYVTSKGSDNSVALKDKVHKKIYSEPCVVKEQSVKDRSCSEKTRADRFEASDCKRFPPRSVKNDTPSFCCIYFDGSRTIKRKKHGKRTSKLSSTVAPSEESSLQPNLIQNGPLFKDFTEDEHLKTKERCKHKKSSNKEEVGSAVLENTKHAKFEIVLTPRSDVASHTSEIKSESPSTRRKKVILQSNTLELGHVTESERSGKRTVTNKTIPFELSLDLNNEESAGDGDIKFYKRNHKKRHNPVVLTMSTFVCANIKGINTFSSFQNPEKRLPVPHRQINAAEEEIQPYYIPVQQNKNNQVEESNPGTETQQTSQIVKFSQIPRRFIGNKSGKLAENADKNNNTSNLVRNNNTSDGEKIIVASDESCATISDATTNNQSKLESDNGSCFESFSSTSQNTSAKNEIKSPKVATENRKTNESEFFEKFKSFCENDSNHQFVQFCKFMSYVINHERTSTNEGQPGKGLDFNNFMKMAGEFYKNFNTGTEVEKPQITKIPRKISDNGGISDRNKKISSRVVKGETEKPILKRRNTLVGETTFHESSFKSTHLNKCLAKSGQVIVKRQTGKNKTPSLISKSQLTEIGAKDRSPYRRFQKAVKKFAMNKNQEKCLTKANSTAAPNEQPPMIVSTEQITDKSTDNNSKSDIEKQVLSPTISKQKIDIALSAREPSKSECSEEINNKKVEDSSDRNLENKNSSCKTNTEFKRAKTFCSKMDCLPNTPEDLSKKLSLIPLTKNCITNKPNSPLKFSFSNIVQDNCREKSKFSHASAHRDHTPGCIYNSSFLFTKCNTEQSRESSFQKRKEYNMRWRKLHKEKRDSRRDLQKTNHGCLNDEQISQLLRNEFQNCVCTNAKRTTPLDNKKKSRETVTKSISKQTISKTKLSSNQQIQGNSKSISKFPQSTFNTPSRFAFQNQDRPRKNYVEVSLPSFICPARMWLRNGTSPRNNNVNSTVNAHTQNLTCSQVDNDEKQQVTENSKSAQTIDLVRECTSSTISTKTKNKKISIRNRFLLYSSKQKRVMCKQKEKKKESTTGPIEQWFRSISKKNSNRKHPQFFNKARDAAGPSTTGNKSRGHYVNYSEIRKNPITGKVFSNRTVAFVRDPLPAADGTFHSDAVLEVVHQNVNFSECNEEKSCSSEQIKESKEGDVKNGTSNDTLINCNACDSSVIFGENVSQSNVTVISSNFVCNFQKTTDENNASSSFNDVSNSGLLCNESKNKLVPRKSSRKFSLQKVSSHLGRFFRGKR